MGRYKPISSFSKELNDKLNRFDNWADTSLYLLFLKSSMTNLIDGGERQIVEGREVSTIAGDVDLASATDLLQHRLERRIKQTRVETVPAKKC